MRIFLLIVIFPITVLGQSMSSNKIKMETYWGSSNQELQDILNFQDINYLKSNFTSPELKGKNYQIISKEVWGGRIIKVDTLINTMTNQRAPSIKSDTLSLRITASKTKDDELKVYFKMPGISIVPHFEALNREDYLFTNIGSDQEIAIGKSFYPFVYMLPYEDENDLMNYCTVNDSGIDVESWGTDFGLKHYIIFEMLFE